MSKKKSSESVGENGAGDVTMVGDVGEEASTGGKKVQEEEQLVLWRYVE